ncbi:di-heme oxidoredictase family protein [Bradyrhizobium sp. McL0615]|uniref:di-heme oxidoredictase family protein n=1 Tax=Bradyrhizobium sp. McL0615 TaxID=3415673 RepID=UPI003CF8A9BC
MARAHTLAGLAVILLGSAAWSGTALAQAVSNPTTSAAAANTNAANANVDTNAVTANAAGRGAQNNNSGGASSRAPTDPGVRGGDPGAGGALPGLNDVERQYFDVAKDVFQEVDAGPDGLGPRFNLDSCSGCHSHPTIGGTSPATNPQVAVATLMGAKNVVPSFITANGPIREARFVRNRDGSPDGGVHSIFVITGRSDAPGCNIAQPNFAAELARNNVVFRIPTPVFGLGLVENISDGALEASLAANAQQKRALGISGRFNRNGNDGTIARFGWKAQNKSLLLFSGEAYNVEMGITNELFQNERESDPACQFKVTPNDHTPLVSENTASPSASFQNDIDLFAAFMRFSAPPTPASAAATPVAQATGASNVAAGQTTGTATGASTTSSSASTMMASATADVSSVIAAAAGSPAAQPSSSAASGGTVTRGNQVFSNVGCQACHTKTFTTEKSPLTGQSNVTIQPLSDFALHEMGAGLADGVSQGTANGNEFRTAPLWGVGQRIFFLHDGRTKDLHEAIQQHASRGSEANAVINNYNLLSRDDKQALINYLRSL